MKKILSLASLAVVLFGCSADGTFNGPTSDISSTDYSKCCEIPPASANGKPTYQVAKTAKQCTAAKAANSTVAEQAKGGFGGKVVDASKCGESSQGNGNGNGDDNNQQSGNYCFIQDAYDLCYEIGNSCVMTASICGGIDGSSSQSLSYCQNHADYIMDCDGDIID